MKTNNIVYLTDEYIYLKNKKKKDIIRYKINDGIISGGKISNIKNFIKTYEKLLNEFHLNNSLFGDAIKIIVLPSYLPSEINMLKNIFMVFNYRKIIIEKELKYFKLSNNNAYINVYNNYISISYFDEFKKINNLYFEPKLFKNEQDLIKYLKYILNSKEIYLLGNGNLLNTIFSDLENNTGLKTYLYSNHETYILDKSKQQCQFLSNDLCCIILPYVLKFKCRKEWV